VAAAAIAERWLHDAPHRQLRCDDAAGGERLSEALCARGWERRRTLLMVMAAEHEWPAPDPRAREISEAELQALQLLHNAETDFGRDTTPELPRLLTAAQAAMRAGTTALRFGAGVDGGLQSSCTLYLDPDVHGQRVAMVEAVGTLRDYRERGLAKAAIGAALRAAERWGAGRIVIPSDADDWPQVFYAGLGFEPAGLQVSFVLRPGL
jgi:GNAT superfamily N-acetyltransferase